MVLITKIMKYKVKAIIKDVTMTPNGPIIEQEIESVRRDFVEEYGKKVLNQPCVWHRKKKGVMPDDIPTY